VTPLGGGNAEPPERPASRAPPPPGAKLATRLVLLVAGIVPVLLATGYVLLQEARDLLRAQLAESGRTLAFHFEQFAQDKMLVNDWAEVRRAITEVVERDPDIRAIELLTNGRLAAGTLLGPEDPSKEVRVGFEMKARIDAKRTRDLGKLTIAYRTDRIDRFLGRASAWVAGGTVGLSAFLVLWLLGNLRRLVFLPIRELTAYARAFGAGVEPPPVHRARKAEFAVLAGALSTARRAVDERDRALHAQFESVRAAYLQLESILQSLGEGVLVADDEEKVVLTNGAVAGLLGPRDLVLGRRIREFLPLEVDAKGSALPFAFPEERKPPRSFTTRVGRRSVRWSLARVAGGGQGRIQYVAVLRDVTLEREEAAMKDEFIASVSHELRTPLTSILAFTEILLSAPPEDRRTQQEFLEIIQRESGRMSELVNDILDISRLEGGAVRFRIERVDVVGLAKEVAVNFRAVAEKANVQLRIEDAPDTPAMTADRQRVVQVLVNLVSNGIKFTPPGGRLTIETRGETEGEAGGNRLWCVVEVRDTGLGIAAEDLPRVFERFTQIGDPLVSKPKGTGLGLSISRAIVERLGGQISARSTPGEGSTFSFRIPAWAGERTAVDPGAPPLPQGGAAGTEPRLVVARGAPEGAEDPPTGETAPEPA
jgi:signal transduction histidine kinase